MSDAADAVQANVPENADALLRRLYLRHASDEQRHAMLFRQRGNALLREFLQADIDCRHEIGARFSLDP